MNFQPVQLVEKAKEYTFKPCVEKGLDPYKVYYLVKNKRVYKMSSLDYTNKFIIMPLFSYSDCCNYIVNKQEIVEELLNKYDEIYTVPSLYDNDDDNRKQFNEAFYNLTKWIYTELIPELMYDNIKSYEEDDEDDDG